MRAPGQHRRVALAALARDAGALVALAGLIFGLHYNSLDHGLFLDDYAHFRQLQECDWSLSGLVDACRLELIGGTLELWFMPDCTLRFFRPLAFALMKLTYVLGGWEPAIMHVASLLWHVLVCTLLMLLLRRFGATPLLAWGVAGLFAIHPGHVVTVQWVACQTELMTTAFLLAATLCYLRFRNWSVAPGPEARRATGYTCAAGCVLFYLAALACRENAVMLPLVLLGIEHLLWRRRTRDAVLLFVGLGVVALLYVIVRGAYLGAAGLPSRPYLTSPGDAGFARFVLDKLCYYLLGEFFLVPSVPFSGMDYLRERPLVFYGLTAAAAGLLALVYSRSWRREPGLLGPAWLVGFMAPVLPVFASPHHLYLPGVGWALTAMLILRRIGGGAGHGRLRQAGMWTCMLLFGAGLGAMTLSFGQVVDTAQRVEDLVATEIAATPGGLKDGDRLYVVNLPLIAHNVRLAVEQQTGTRNLRVYALTWAPRVLGLVGTDVESEITWDDERTIEVRVVGDRYFAGPFRRLVAGAPDQPVPTQTTRSCREDGFRAEVLAGGDDGVSRLRFTFDSPLSDAGVHLFWGSRTLWAFEVQADVRP